MELFFSGLTKDWFGGIIELVNEAVWSPHQWEIEHRETSMC